MVEDSIISIRLAFTLVALAFLILIVLRIAFPSATHSIDTGSCLKYFGASLYIYASLIRRR